MKLKLPTGTPIYNAVIFTQQELLKLKNEVEQLRAQLHQNIKNLYRPSSIDQYRRKPAQPKKKALTPADHLGHDGKNLEMIEVADEYNPHFPKKYSYRQDSAKLNSNIKGPYQAFDFPRPELVITKHLSMTGIYPKCKNLFVDLFGYVINKAAQYNTLQYFYKKLSPL